MDSLWYPFLFRHDTAGYLGISSTHRPRSRRPVSQGPHLQSPSAVQALGRLVPGGKIRPGAFLLRHAASEGRGSLEQPETTTLTALPPG